MGLHLVNGEWGAEDLGLHIICVSGNSTSHAGNCIEAFVFDKLLAVSHPKTKALEIVWVDLMLSLFSFHFSSIFFLHPNQT